MDTKTTTNNPASNINSESSKMMSKETNMDDKKFPNQHPGSIINELPRSNDRPKSYTVHVKNISDRGWKNIRRFASSMEFWMTNNSRFRDHLRRYRIIGTSEKNRELNIFLDPNLTEDRAFDIIFAACKTGDLECRINGKDIQRRRPKNEYRTSWDDDEE